MKVVSAEQVAGYWRVYEKPAKGVEYLVVGDPALGWGGDPSAAHVLTRNQSPNRQVAVFEGQIDTFRFARELKSASDQYAGARIAVEDNGLGTSVVGKLAELRARQITRSATDPITRKQTTKPGWHTGPGSWQRAFAALLTILVDGELVLSDRRSILQLKLIHMERNKEGDLVPATERFTGQKGVGGHKQIGQKHDDLVKSLAIGAQILLTQRSQSATMAAKAPSPEGSGTVKSKFQLRSGKGAVSTWELDYGAVVK